MTYLFYKWKLVVPINPLYLFCPFYLFTSPLATTSFFLCLYKSFSVFVLLFICGVFVVVSYSVVSYSLQPLNCSIPGFPILHYLSEFAETHVHSVSDAIQPCQSLSPPSPLASAFPSIKIFSMSPLFISSGQSIGASASASVLPVNIQD